MDNLHFSAFPPDSVHSKQSYKTNINEKKYISSRVMAIEKYKY